MKRRNDDMKKQKMIEELQELKGLLDMDIDKYIEEHNKKFDTPITREQYYAHMVGWVTAVITYILEEPSAQPEQRYTEEELRVFAHGISLSLLSKRSAQHWRYDKDTATEIEFLERLYDKVGADIRGEQDG